MKNRMAFYGIWAIVATVVGAGSCVAKSIGNFTIPAPQKGDPGESAHVIWLRNGGQGDEEAFLASLRGNNGKNGCSPKVVKGTPDPDTGCYEETTTNYKLNENGECVPDGDPSISTEGCRGTQGCGIVSTVADKKDNSNNVIGKTVRLHNTCDGDDTSKDQEFDLDNGTAGKDACQRLTLEESDVAGKYDLYCDDE